MLHTYSNENNIQNLSEIEQLRAEGTHNEANEGTYLDQLNNNTIQMTSCTIKKRKNKNKTKRRKYIYIYLPIKTATMNQSVSIWREHYGTV